MPEPPTREFTPLPPREEAASTGDYPNLPSGNSLPTAGKDVAAARLAQQQFTVLREHAQGGLGKVSVARDEKLKREVALKEIRPDRLSPLARQRFLNEAEITGQLEHPGIVPIYSLQEDDQGQPSYTMRFIQGRTLGEAIKAYHEKPDPLAFRGLLQRFISVCQTMAYAHSKGIIHRDLKPANIMLGDYGETLVLDWGLAKRAGPVAPSEPGSAPTGDTPAPAELPETVVVPPDTPQTRQGDVLGTPAYMSPEQARGETGQHGPATDIYALGAILYELLAGRPPFAGNVFDVLEQVKAGLAPPSPVQVTRRSPPALAAVCRKAMAPLIADRYPTATDLAQEVERFLADEPVLAVPEPLSARARRWLRKHRALTVSSVVILVVAVVALAVSLAYIKTAKDETEHALEKERNALANERVAKARAREVIFTLTSETQLKAMEKTPRLTAEQEALLRTLVGWYQEYAQEEALTEDAVERQAEAYDRLSEMLIQLGQMEAATEACRQAVRVYQRRASLLARDDLCQGDWANACLRLGHMLDNIGQLAEAEASYLRARQILQHLVATVPAESSHRIDLGRVWTRLGMLQEKTGRYAAAETSYLQAQRLLAPYAGHWWPEPDAWQGLAEAHAALARLHGQVKMRSPEAEGHYQQARGGFERLASYHPNDPRYQSFLASLLHDQGTFYRNLRRYAEAEDCYMQCIRIDERLAQAFPSVANYQDALARVRLNLGILQQMVKWYPQAEENYHRARRLLERLVAQDPQVHHLHAVLAGVWSHLGHAQLEQGHVQEALVSFRHALTTLEQLTATLPQVEQYQVDLTHYWTDLGKVQVLARQHQAAEHSLQQAERLASHLLARQPDQTRPRHALAVIRFQQGTLHARNQRLAPATACFQEAEQLLERLRTAHPEVPSFALTLTDVLCNHGAIQQQDGKVEAAEATFRRAEQILTRFVAASPGEAIVNLGAVYCNLGNLYHDSGRWAAALESFQRATDLLEPAHRDQPRDVQVRQCLRNSYFGRATTLGQLDRPAEATRDWQRAWELDDGTTRADLQQGRERALVLALRQAEGQARAGCHYHVAKTAALLSPLTGLAPDQRLQLVRLLARCIASPGVLGFFPPTATEQDRYATRALELLRRLQADAAFQEARHWTVLLHDPDFAPLRQRPEWETLMKELGK